MLFAPILQCAGSLAAMYGIRDGEYRKPEQKS